MDAKPRQLGRSHRNHHRHEASTVTITVPKTNARGRSRHARRAAVRTAPTRAMSGRLRLVTALPGRSNDLSDSRSFVGYESGVVCPGNGHGLPERAGHPPKQAVNKPKLSEEPRPTHRAFTVQPCGLEAVFQPILGAGGRVQISPSRLKNGGTAIAGNDATPVMVVVDASQLRICVANR